MGTMAGALEMGAFDFARGVLDTFFHYGIRKRHFATPEGVASGADLWAMYAQYTGDIDIFLKYWDKVESVFRNLRGFRCAQPTFRNTADRRKWF
eukprot:COSAG04_NODE_277_length_18399_cov_3.036066_6_plen_94_part_00